MKTVLSVLVVSLLFCVTAECGELTGSAGLKFNTGDAEFDVTLSNLNDESSLDVNAFVGDMSLSFGTSKEKVEKLISETKMRPADVYIALNIAKMMKKSLKDVVKEYKTNRKKGWGVIAKNLGIKPGSEEFHKLKSVGKAKLEKIKKAKKEKGKAKAKARGKGKAKGRDKAGDEVEDEAKGKAKGKGRGKSKW